MTLNADQLRHLSGVFAKMADLAQEAEALLARPVTLDVKGVLARNPVGFAAVPAAQQAEHVPAASPRNLPPPENPWSAQDVDRAIAEIVKAMAAGHSKSEGYRMAGAALGRTANAVQVRLRKDDGDRLEAALRAAGIAQAPKHIAGDAPPGTSGGAWTEAEDEAIRAAIRDNPRLSINALGKLLAETLDRTAGAISYRIGKVILPAMKAEKAPKSAPAVAPVPAPEVQKPAAPAPAVAPVSAAFIPMPDSLPFWQRDLRLAINAIGYPEGHDAETDLELVEELSRGRKVAAVAEDLGLTEADALARFKALREAASFDRPFGLTEQHRLIDELRARVKIARGAA